MFQDFRRNCPMLYLMLITIDINKAVSKGIRRRDAYVVSRCLILHQRLSWRLDLADDAAGLLFQRLVEIFKTRKFADLRGEIAGFAVFVQENDASLMTVPATVARTAPSRSS
jgi:hypothetical protein